MNLRHTQLTSKSNEYNYANERVFHIDFRENEPQNKHSNWVWLIFCQYLAAWVDQMLHP